MNTRLVTVCLVLSASCALVRAQAKEPVFDFSKMSPPSKAQVNDMQQRAAQRMRDSYELTEKARRREGAVELICGMPLPSTVSFRGHIIPEGSQFCGVPGESTMVVKLSQPTSGDRATSTLIFTK